MAGAGARARARTARARDAAACEPQRRAPTLASGDRCPRRAERRAMRDPAHVKSQRCARTRAPRRTPASVFGTRRPPLQPPRPQARAESLGGSCAASHESGGPNRGRAVSARRRRRAQLGGSSGTRIRRSSVRLAAATRRRTLVAARIWASLAPHADGSLRGQEP
ncbi:hypothetical protein B0H15DRAFT_442609 [Mycena belliarum]|uniref:Uncharacterized protein n=1 Tax=Mycena belliarum TaxID=1033014 RepID=A0AAD6TWM4_9AGAR|nr:hypothetical protein B0H15DRAFT_442609 [Mycena belliae]